MPKIAQDTFTVSNSKCLPRREKKAVRLSGYLGCRPRNFANIFLAHSEPRTQFCIHNNKGICGQVEIVQMYNNIKTYIVRRHKVHILFYSDLMNVKLIRIICNAL